MGVDISGFSELEEKFSDLQRRGDGDRRYTVGTNVEYAIYLEMGTRHMPPYPFFRPALFELEADPEGFILDNTNYSSIEEIPTANELVDALAFALERQLKANATAGDNDRSPGVHPDHPKVQTGNLRASISAVRIK